VLAVRVPPVTVTVESVTGLASAPAPFTPAERPATGEREELLPQPAATAARRWKTGSFRCCGGQSPGRCARLMDQNCAQAGDKTTMARPLVRAGHL